MSENTNQRTPNPKNPSSLKPRYEIRKLGPEHAEWAAAIVAHSNGFHSTVWPVLYPENLNKLVHDIFQEATYLVNHQIESDLSYGVFDTAYEYKTEEGRKAGGKLLWDRSESSIEKTEGLPAESARMLKQMDFPLVSVALSYDSINPLNMEKMKPLIACLPHFGVLYGILMANDLRHPDSWKATGPNQVLFRNATSTRHDYEGEKIMSGLARWLMREADQKGFRGIQIECVADAVIYVWSKAEPPYKGSVVSELHTTTWKDEEDNLAFAPADQRIAKIYVDLKPGA